MVGPAPTWAGQRKTRESWWCGLKQLAGIQSKRSACWAVGLQQEAAVGVLSAARAKGASERSWLGLDLLSGTLQCRGPSRATKGCAPCASWDMEHQLVISNTFLFLHPPHPITQKGEKMKVLQKQTILLYSSTHDVAWPGGEETKGTFMPEFKNGILIAESDRKLQDLPEMMWWERVIQHNTNG